MNAIVLRCLERDPARRYASPGDLDAALARLAASLSSGVSAGRVRMSAPRGRLATVTQGTGPDQRTAIFSYTSAGFLETIVDPLGRAVSFAYDAAGRITTQTLPDGRVIQYSYDANRQRVSVLMGAQPVRRWRGPGYSWRVLW